MADGNQPTIKLDQDTLDRSHSQLDRLISRTERARVQACNEGQTEARDTLERVGAHLRMARAEAGSLSLSGGVRPRSGDK